MIRLSQRGWNNVIIFTTLILILLFNFSSNFLNRGTDNSASVSSLVPSGWVITTMQYKQDTVERIGQGWRIKSGKMSHDDLAKLVNNWQSAEVELFDAELNWQSSEQVVKLWFAGQAQPVEYAFLPFADKTLVRIDEQTYQLARPSFGALMIDN